MEFAVTLAQWTVRLEGSAWMHHAPEPVRVLFAGGLRCLLWLVAVVEVGFLLFGLTRSHGLRICFEAVKLAVTLLHIEDEEDEKSGGVGGQTTRGGFREAFFIQRNFHSAINHLHAASATFISTSSLASSIEAHDRLRDLVDTQERPPRVTVEELHVLLLRLAYGWHETTNLHLNQLAEVRPDLFFRIETGLAAPVSSLPNYSGVTKINLLLPLLPHLRVTIGERLDANLTSDTHRLYLLYAAFRLFRLMLQATRRSSTVSDRHKAAIQHFFRDADSHASRDKFRAIEAAYELKIETSPTPPDPPPHQPYLRFLQHVDAVTSGFSLLLDSEEVESLLEPYLRCVGAEIAATKAEEKLFDAILEAVLRREELKRMIKEARRNKQEREEEVKSRKSV